MADYKKLIVDDTVYETLHTRKFTERREWAKPDPDKLTAQIPGVIKEVLATPGRKVKWGESLLVLEAMKMRNDVVSPREGVIRSVNCKTGQMVPKGYVLVEFEKKPDNEAAKRQDSKTTAKSR